MSESTDADTVSLRVEATTMALYVTIALLATIIALGEHEEHGAAMFRLIWGATLGLTVAHFVAFRIASTVARGREFRQHDLTVGLAQFGAAAGVAIAATAPILLLPAQHETEGVLWVLAGVLGLTGYQAGRSAGASRMRSFAMGSGVAAVGILAAIFKLVLGGH